MLFVFLSANVGVTFAAHYCKGEVNSRELMFVETQIACDMDMEEECEMEEQTCPMHQTPPADPDYQNLKSDDCCDNEYVTVKIEDDFTSEKTELTSQLLPAIAVIIAFVPELVYHFSPKISFNDKSPPLTGQDIIVRVQSFLL